MAFVADNTPSIRSPTVPKAPCSAENQTQTPSLDDDCSIPDGGHGWIVLIGCTVVSWWSIGTAQSFGVLQAALLKEGVSTSVNLLFVGSLSAGLVPAFAIFYARAMRAWGTRANAMLGIYLMSLGSAISSVVFRDIGALFAAYGVLMGVGMGFTFTVCLVVVVEQVRLLEAGLGSFGSFSDHSPDGGGCSYAVLSAPKRFGQWHYLCRWWCWRRCGQRDAQCCYRASRDRLGASHSLCSSGWHGASCCFRYPGEDPLPTLRSGRLVGEPCFCPCCSVTANGSPQGNVSVYHFRLTVPRRRDRHFPTLRAAILLVSLCELDRAISQHWRRSYGGFQRGVCSGFLSDRLGALDVLFMALVLTGLSMLVIWPFASSLGVAVVFVIVGGTAVGGFFSTMPTAVGHVLGSAIMSLVMGMILTSWTGGYVMVSKSLQINGPGNRS